MFQCFTLKSHLLLLTVENLHKSPWFQIWTYAECLLRRTDFGYSWHLNTKFKRTRAFTSFCDFSGSRERESRSSTVRSVVRSMANCPCPRYWTPTHFQCIHQRLIAALQCNCQSMTCLQCVSVCVCVKGAMDEQLKSRIPQICYGRFLLLI